MVNLLFIVSGPAGCGKTTLVEKVVKEHPEVRRLVTTTTRDPRKGEVEGGDYYFQSRSSFEARIAAEEFIEYATYNGNLYGLTKSEMHAKLEIGPAIAILDVQGADTIRKLEIPHKSIFVLPPSWEELKRRIEARGTESPESIANRIDIAAHELLQVDKFDWAFPNADIEHSFERLWNYIRENSEGKS